MNKWAIVAIPLVLCLVLMEAVVRQFVADRAFRRGKQRVERYEKVYVLYLRGKTKRPAPITSVGTWLEKAVKLERRCPEYHNYLGRYYQALATEPSASDIRRIRLAKQAIEQYEKAVDLDPLNGAYRAYLAYMQGVMGAHGKAVANFEEAIKLNRSNLWIRQMYEAYRERVISVEEIPEPLPGQESRRKPHGNNPYPWAPYTVLRLQSGNPGTSIAWSRVPIAGVLALPLT